MTQVARMKPSRQSFLLNGFTLVELLVVIAVIAILMGFLIPAVSSVRESARLMECRGHLRQLAQACTSYANASGVLPTAGSAGRLGDPNANTLGTRGGWLYLILPFVEQQPLYDLGAGLTGASLNSAIITRVGTPVALFSCANRGSPVFTAPPLVDWRTAYPGIGYARASDGGGINPGPPLLARSDYAGCWAGQDDRSNGALGRNPWSDNGRLLRSITDGQTNVFLCGERYLPPVEYRPEPLSSPTEWVSQRRECNNKGWSVSHEGDVYATGVGQPPMPDSAGIPGCPSMDSRWAGRFGSPHAGVPMAMVDGSVHLVAFDISPGVFAAICNISDNSGVADQLR